LPRSFEDAARIARYLEIQYLWIDSLCIKQDSDDRSDWVEESQKMGHAYLSSGLNVSA
ncbi:heterokaryon incompatibility, partial [Thozetella sp. PMI_491]